MTSAQLHLLLLKAFATDKRTKMATDVSDRPSARRTSSDSRRSFDSERIHSPPLPSTTPNGINGKHDDADADLENMDPIERLEHELQRTKDEKDALGAQYRNLLSKLTTMRTTLGNKLKQDAVRCMHYVALSGNITMTIITYLV